MRYWPAPSVTTVRVFSINAGLDASTVTPGRTAPEPSRTTPAMDPCAIAAAGRRLAHSTMRTLDNQRTIVRLPSIATHCSDAGGEFGLRTPVGRYRFKTWRGSVSRGHSLSMPALCAGGDSSTERKLTRVGG